METLRQKLSRRMRELMDTNLSANTQVKVGAKSGVSQSSVQRVLVMEQAATVDILEQLAKAFNLSRPEYLLLEDDEGALLKEWAGLAPTEKQTVLGYIRLVAKTKREQLVIDAGRPVGAELRAPQKAAATRPASSEAPVQHAAKPSTKRNRRA
jgi:transcriptional regulator with XRE-family HTH domain